MTKEEAKKRWDEAVAAKLDAIAALKRAEAAWRAARDQFIAACEAEDRK